MTKLYTCQPCKDGKHEDCELTTSNPSYFGGRRCMCLCHGKNNKELKHIWENMSILPKREFEK